MCFVHERLAELRRRIDDLENHLSSNPNVEFIHVEDKNQKKNFEIFNGAFTQQDFLVLALYTLTIMILTKFIIRSK